MAQTALQGGRTVKTYTTHEVAIILAEAFGDDCACNFNGNDEWLGEKCKYAETDCPYPKEDNGCWKEFVRAMYAKMNGKDDNK